MTDSKNLLQIDTPENITFDYEIAGIGSRFLAALIDTALIILLQVMVWGAVFLAYFGISEYREISEVTANWVLAITGIISFIFLWGFYIFFEILWNGQTPGKRRVGLRVIRVDGTPVSASEVVIRNLVRMIDFLPTAYGIGVVTMFINSNSRRVGDLAAGTVVVHDRAVKDLSELSPIQLTSLKKINEQIYLPENFPIQQVSEPELHVIEEFLSRRTNLANSQTLAKHILTSILTRLQFPEDTLNMIHAESILAEIYSTRRSQATN